MAEPINKIVDVERIEVAPAGGENVDDPTKKDGEGADDQGGAAGGDEGGADGAAGVHKPEELIDHSKPVVKPAGEKPEGGDDGKGKVGSDGLRDVSGETPRERALRAQLSLTKKQLRSERGQELGIENAPVVAAAPAKREPSAANQEILKKYKPAEIQALREVLPALADEMGYVKAQDLSAQGYAQQGQAVLDEFLEQHPEYLPENDEGGVLWNAFKTEYGLYNKPANPKDFAKIFNRIHTAIFGIKPAGNNGAINAAREKINVASHAGASGPGRSGAPARPSAAAAGVRLDMLKGFSDEDLQDIASRASG